MAGSFALKSTGNSFLAIRNPRRWWQKTVQMTMATAILAGLLCIAAMFAGASAPAALAGIPANMLLAALLIPVAAGVLMFAMAGWQDNNNRRCNLSHRDGGE